MRAAVMAAVLTFGLSAAAQATVTYTLENPAYNSVATNAGATLNFSLTIQDAAVAAGSFSLTGTPGYFPSGSSPSYSGDVADFVSFTANETATPTDSVGNLSISATFAADGTITSSSFTYRGVNERSALSGSSNSFGGTFGSDDYDFQCGSDACAVTGQLVEVATVPEPASLALLGAGVLGMMVRRRRA